MTDSEILEEKTLSDVRRIWMDGCYTEVGERLEPVLAEMNDCGGSRGDGLSFNDIALWIEDNLVPSDEDD